MNYVYARVSSVGQKVTNHQLSWWFGFAPPEHVARPPKGGSQIHQLLAAS